MDESPQHNISRPQQAAEEYIQDVILHLKLKNKQMTGMDCWVCKHMPCKFKGMWEQ